MVPLANSRQGCSILVRSKASLVTCNHTHTHYCVLFLAIGD